MRKYFLIFMLAMIPAVAKAQEKTAPPDTVLFSNEYLDTVKLRKKARINDYMLVGVNYGMSFCNTYFNPGKNDKAFVMSPNYVSVMFTKYSKLFDILPYCGLTFGLAYGHEGYSFKPNEESGYTQNVDGAEWCSMEVVEMPFMTQIHLDADPVKFMADVGVYGGYRLSVDRRGAGLDPQYAKSFREYERRFDYGLQGGGGIALMFSPIEIHFNCLVRWAWSSLYEPDYNSSYFYRFAYPLDIMATVGIHFQLTKRNGKTSGQLRHEAKGIVYGETTDSAGQSRQ